MYNFSNETSFSRSHVTRTADSPKQDGNDAVYSFFVDYPSESGPIQYNLVAGILSMFVAEIKNQSNFDVQVLSSNLAPSPPESSSVQNSSAVTLSASNIENNASLDVSTFYTIREF